MPKIDSILDTIIARTNDVIQQIKNPKILLPAIIDVRNIIFVLRDYRNSVVEACDQMQILDSVIDFVKIDSVTMELQSLPGNTENSLYSASISPFLRYLNEVLRTLNELNSDNEGVSVKSEMNFK
jgi:hypothetical protein